MGKHVGKRKEVNPAVYKPLLKKLFPDSKILIRKGKLDWRVILKPSPMSNTYSIKLVYIQTSRPRVYLLEPVPIRKGSKSIPHTYSKNELCLFHPRYNEWRSGLHVCDYIVPWICEWLLHYEIWYATGEWCGGGEHPSKKETM